MILVSRISCGTAVTILVAMKPGDTVLTVTPLLATWSIWVGLGVSARSSDVRVAQQLGVLVSLPPVFVAVLIALNVIHATLGLGLGLGAALLVLDGLGWRIMAATFDRERLVTGTQS